ncbi:hypothetical protein CYMTET_30331 [Cymbomonas tetramitiformis]|uniref:Glutaredoxin domain-containing protein n=1 Tax=Cymbomonas tetramitiformis TaxID=36881 RepID=A0AAE0F5N3_9CHLO|nr:hypothetical protein CYMTET_38476 [Cymbomonas tetramitiformis]KAK3260733.1 hypothetical protein CYMTET_30331 [Cymbomonas tetramitiformis]|eukprot:gene19814-23698_t
MALSVTAARPSLKFSNAGSFRARTNALATARKTTFVVTAEAKTPSPALKVGSGITKLLKPFFAATAKIQAGDYDQEAVAESIEADVNSDQVVVYSYSLSPFCTEAVDLLESAGAEPTVIELGKEWIPGLLDSDGAAVRCELGQMTGQTSMPHIFINGESIGGLHSGTPGLAALLEDGTLEEMLNPPKPVKTGGSNPFAKLFSR